MLTGRGAGIADASFLFFLAFSNNWLLGWRRRGFALGSFGSFQNAHTKQQVSAASWLDESLGVLSLSEKPPLWWWWWFSPVQKDPT